jgi:hypothetical protein
MDRWCGGSGVAAIIILLNRFGYSHGTVKPKDYERAAKRDGHSWVGGGIKGGKQIFGLLLDGGNFEDLNVPLGRQFDLENRSRLVFGRIKEIKT